MKKTILLIAICFSIKINAQTKKLIIFNAKGKPANMGQSQLIDADSLQSFIKERKAFLPDAKTTKNRIYYYTVDSVKRERYAIIVDVPNDFEN